MIYKVRTYRGTDICTISGPNFDGLQIRVDRVPSFIATHERLYGAATAEAALALHRSTHPDAAGCRELRHHDDEVDGG